jgi:hypothetical protein
MDSGTREKIIMSLRGYRSFVRITMLLKQSTDVNYIKISLEKL